MQSELLGEVMKEIFINGDLLDSTMSKKEGMGE